MRFYAKSPEITMLIDASQQAYCLEQMGIVSWVPQNSSFESPTILRPTIPWITEHSQSAEFLGRIDKGSKQDKSSFGFQSTPVASDPELTQKTVAELKEELLSNSSVIVEDLQPIEEFAVDILPSQEIEDAGLQAFSAQLYAIENRLLILTHIPQQFQEFDVIENMALKMSQALLKQSIQEWQSAHFSWPDRLNNSYFVEKTDWMLGAFESFIERYLEDLSSSVTLIIAGQQLQKVVELLPETSPIHNLVKVNIDSLPELYRIPELKKDAWGAMKKVVLV